MRVVYRQKELAEASQALANIDLREQRTRSLSNGRTMDSKTAENKMRTWPKGTKMKVVNTVSRSTLVVFAMSFAVISLKAQNLAPTPPSSAQAELSKVEEWVLSQGTAESIAPELAAILGLGSDRLPVKIKSFLTTDGINLAFAVSTNPKQEGIVISALKTITDKTEIYSVGNAWLTDRSGILRQTIAVDASGAKILPNSSHAAKFEDIKAFFAKKPQVTSPNTILSPSPRRSGTAIGGKDTK